MKLKPINWHEERDPNGKWHYSSARVADVNLTIDHVDCELIISHKDMKEQWLPMVSVQIAKNVAEQMVLERIFLLFESTTQPPQAGSL